MVLAVELRKIRQHVGFSMKEFADLLDIGYEAYRKYEVGEREHPKDLDDRLRKLFPEHKQTGMKLDGKIDYLRIRFKTLDFKTIIDRVLKLKDKPFTVQPNGRYSYNHFVKFGDINIYFSSEDTAMGTLVELSGSGCRQFEWYMINEQKRDWKDFFNACVTFARSYAVTEAEQRNFLKFTRIDIALDEYYNEKGNFDLYSLKLKEDKGLIKRKAKSFKFIDGSFGKESKGKSIYFGSENSPIVLNFYEKDLEQADKFDLPVEFIHSQYGFKNRYEVRLLDKYSDEFVWEWLSSYDQFNLSDKAVRIINDKVHVFTKRKGKIELDQSWYALMGSYGSFRFEMKPAEYDIGLKEYRWYDKSVSRTVQYLLALEIIRGQYRLSDMTMDVELTDEQKANLEFERDRLKVDLSLEEVLLQVRKNLDWV